MGSASAVSTADPVRVYRPRHPERTGFYRLFEKHFDPFLAYYNERFEAEHGPLRAHVARTVYDYLDCGRLQGGFARIRCPQCHSEHLLAFSCQTRNFCPSCQAKRAALFGEQLVLRILADVPHRHVVFTIPKALRGLFQRERGLLGLLTHCAHACVQTMLRQVTGHPRAQVGMVNAIQTFGSFAANFHPHVHALVTDGVFLPDGSFERVWRWDQDALSELFRRMVLAALRREERLTEETHLKLLSWEHAGFSVHPGAPILPDDTQTLELLARYLCRAPLRMDNVRELAQRVIVRTPPDPLTGATELKLDPLELVRRLCEQIPAPRQHQVRYCGWYSNRSRGTRRLQAEPVERPTYAHAQQGEGGPEESGPAPKDPKGQGDSPSSRSPSPPPSQAGRDPALDTPAARARRRSWGRLLRRLYEVDPLLCPQCIPECISAS